MTPAKRRLPPIHREVVVQADITTAYDVFTGSIGSWWPLAELSVSGAGATVAFVDGALIETAADGQRSTWGTVLEWEPPHALTFSWHPGHDEEHATEVRVEFVSLGERTLVVLEHRGWERLADPIAAREEYGHGWPEVLAGYVEAVDGEQAWTWVALIHQPKEPGNVFEDPRFGEHVAFLERRAEAGELIAAGPLSDVPGEGMTILRLPGEGRLSDATRLATEDDLAVAGGLFNVTVRPWNVMFGVEAG